MTNPDSPGGAPTPRTGKAVRNIVGNVPEPSELYGRERPIEHIWRQLAGNNILILAPRRFGKSGIMRHLLERPHEEFIPIYLDLMDVDSPQAFAVRLTSALLEQSRLRAFLSSAKGIPSDLKKFISNTVGKIEIQGVSVGLREYVEPGWRNTVQSLVLELEKVDGTVLFLLDEFPVMLATMAEKHGPAVAQDFMAWFSSVRLQSKDTLRRHRFVIAGSIGVDSILRRIDPPDKLRDFERLAIGAIEEEEALCLAADLARALDVDIPEALTKLCLDLIGPRVPYFIQLMYSQLAQLRTAERHPVTEAVLRRVYTEQVLGPTCKHYFDHYRDRLSRYGKEMERAAVALLRAVADEPSGRVGSSVLYDVYSTARGADASVVEFYDLVADLECEWYLCLDQQTHEYFFLVNVMRDWWRRWYGTAQRLKKVQRKR